MSFDIYDVSEYNVEHAQELASEDDKVESGLSPGELRQSLMDRFRREVRSGDPYFLNLNFPDQDFELDEEECEDEESVRSVFMDIENLVYDMLDEDIDGSLWEFSNEIIMVRGE